MLRSVVATLTASSDIIFPKLNNERDGKRMLPVLPFKKKLCINFSIKIAKSLLKSYEIVYNYIQIVLLGE